MEKEFIPYEQSLALKELGFDEPCVYYVDKYNNSYIYNFEIHPDEFIEWCGVNVIPAPLYQQAFRWLLKHHNLYKVIIPTETMNWTFKTMTVVEDMIEVPPYKHIDANDYNTLEEAELACLKKLIEIVKK